MGPEILKENFDILKVNLKEIGLNYFSYGLISQDEVLLSYFTHKEWGNLYQEKHYNKMDPLLHGVIHSHFSLIIWDALHSYGKEKEVMVERNEVCALKSGLTIGIENKGYTEIIALGSEMLPREFHCLLRDENYARKINEMIANFYKACTENFPIQHWPLTQTV